MSNTTLDQVQNQTLKSNAITSTLTPSPQALLNRLNSETTLKCHAAASVVAQPPQYNITILSKAHTFQV